MVCVVAGGIHRDAARHHVGAGPAELLGHVEYSFGQFGTRPGYTWAMHQISADQDGNLYLAEVFGGRTQKYRPKPGANPTELVRGRSLMPMTGATSASAR